MNRLTSENNLQTGILKRYEYDKNGNITKIRKTCRGNAMEDFSFSYGADGRLTELSKYSTSFSPKEYDVSYDDVGNPCVYKDNVLKWERGRLLAAYGDNSYSYNANGVRIKKKTANGILHKYFTEGTRIHCEQYADHTNWYYYDATGVTAMDRDGTRYFFQKNIQGDVIRIFNVNGCLVARYAYDACGNHTVYDSDGNINTDANFIGNINPFRYRGYYFDIETGLYYLNTRYYNPSICRFINADDVSYIEPETINGLNLYSYCGNNPVMGVDPNGTAWWHWALGVLAVAALVAATILSAGGAVAGVAAIYAAALGTVTGGTTAMTTILAFAAVGLGITFAASAIVAGIGSIEIWASGGSFMDGVDSFMNDGESAMWSTIGAGILSGIGGYVTYKERIGTSENAGFMTKYQRDVQRKRIWVGRGNKNGLADPGMQISHLYGTFGNNRNYYIIQSEADHRAFHKLYGYKTFGGHFQRENPAYHNWWVLIKNMLGI